MLDIRSEVSVFARSTDILPNAVLATALLSAQSPENQKKCLHGTWKRIDAAALGLDDILSTYFEVYVFLLIIDLVGELACVL